MTEAEKRKINKRTLTKAKEYEKVHAKYGKWGDSETKVVSGDDGDEIEDKTDKVLKLLLVVSKDITDIKKLNKTFCAKLVRINSKVDKFAETLHHKLYNPLFDGDCTCSKCKEGNEDESVGQIPKRKNSNNNKLT